MTERGTLHFPWISEALQSVSFSVVCRFCCFLAPNLEVSRETTHQKKTPAKTLEKKKNTAFTTPPFRFVLGYLSLLTERGVWSGCTRSPSCMNRTAFASNPYVTWVVWREESTRRRFQYRSCFVWEKQKEERDREELWERVCFSFFFAAF